MYMIYVLIVGSIHKVVVLEYFFNLYRGADVEFWTMGINLCMELLIFIFEEVWGELWKIYG